MIDDKRIEEVLTAIIRDALGTFDTNVLKIDAENGKITLEMSFVVVEGIEEDDYIGFDGDGY